MSKSKERKGMTKIIEIRGPSLAKTTTQFRFYNLSLSLHHFTFSVFLVRQSLSSTSWTPALCLKPYSFRLISRRNDSLLPVIPLKVMVRTTNSHFTFFAHENLHLLQFYSARSEQLPDMDPNLYAGL